MKHLHSAALVLLLVLLTASHLQAAPTPAPCPASTASCGSKCQVRCTKADAQPRCLKYCGICCAKCNCVPSGTYGNKDECPCYRDMLTNKNKPKCP